MAETTLVDRALIRLSGEDVRGFLNGLVTQDVATSLPVWAGLLTPQGKCLFDFIVWTDPSTGSGQADLLIDCEREAAGDLAKRLTLYRLRRRISIDREPDLCVHWAAARTDGTPDPRLSTLGRRWLAPASGEPGADAAWREHRLKLGVTEGRAELVDLLWLECNADELNGVSFTKGCFVGQENTARMNWRSKVNRRLFVVPIGAAPEARVRVAYPELGLAVAHLRIDEVPPEALRPEWMKQDA